MKSRTFFRLVLILGTILTSPLRGLGQTLSTNQVWHYRLLNPSTLVNDCLICEIPTVLLPLRGSFDLVLLERNSLNTRYALTNIDFSVDSANAPQYRITGQGTWQIGGDFALGQTVTLQTTVESGTGTVTRTFTNESQQVQARQPEFEVDLDDTAGLGSVYRMHLMAAPLREIWFSTAAGFKSTNGAGTVNAGDLISDRGRVVRRQSDMVQALGLPSGTFSVDAVDVASGGAVLFSLDQDVTSPTLGLLHNGDAFSERGLVVETNRVLLSAFGLVSQTNDAGLKGLQVMGDGEVLFSINQDVAAKGAGLTLTHGDLLSNSGQVRESNQELLARFQPDTSANLGLKAFHFWPNGEVWFSVETGFNDASLGPVSSGDLLSDQGFIVFNNADLTGALGPAGDVSGFGLTSLFVVTDVEPSAPGPVLSTPAVIPGSTNGDVSLSWNGPGKVFQLDKRAGFGTPFVSASPIIPGTNWIDAGTLSTNASAFYRLRQW